MRESKEATTQSISIWGTLGWNKPISDGKRNVVKNENQQHRETINDYSSGNLQIQGISVPFHTHTHKTQAITERGSSS